MNIFSLSERSLALEKIFQNDGFVKSHQIKELIDLFFFCSVDELLEKKQKVRIAGRVLKIRTLKKFIFSNLMDVSGKIQLKFDLFLKKEFLEQVNVGDIIAVFGVVCKTNVGELTVEVEKFFLLSKCFRLLPSSYYGLKNLEEKFRRRYLDFLVNPLSRDVITSRHRLLRKIRDFLDQQNFLEVETPVLVSAASGALARPFVTYHQKLQKNFYLRIATEIPLKQLLIGGFEKIYELGRVFRNEGIDARHNPEFTSLEVYWAYENCQKMMKLTEDLFSFLIGLWKKKTSFQFNKHVINCIFPFRRLSMKEAVKEYCGVDFNNINNVSQAQKIAEQYNLVLKPFQNTIGHILYSFFENLVEEKLVQPTFVFDYPLETSPLAKKKKNDPQVADRFELFIGGLELANGYSELNDPFEQERRFLKQQEEKKLGNEEVADFDKDFLESLCYGMPPAGGLGIGIDRLVMFFLEKNNIKEVLVFPQLKDDNKHQKNQKKHQV